MFSHPGKTAPKISSNGCMQVEAIPKKRGIESSRYIEYKITSDQRIAINGNYGAYVDKKTIMKD